VLAAVGAIAFAGTVSGANLVTSFQRDVQPILKEYCYDCHGDGAKKGNVAFDELSSEQELLNHDLWLKVLRNVRAGLMPPEKKPKPSTAERATLEKWIKYSAFGIDPQNPDPGRVTVRRLNRTEYRNTIRDLMGYDFKVEDELPPDDTGYGFDNIGDVLSISPLLLEKYMQAGEVIVANAVPRAPRVVAEKVVGANELRHTDGKRLRERLSFYEPASLAHTVRAEHAGDYRVVLECEVLGQFDFDPGKCQIVVRAGEKELGRKELGWQPGQKFRFEFNDQWQPGDQRVSIELKPLTPVEEKKNSLDLRITALRVQGPTAEKFWVRPKNFELFFTQDPPELANERKTYARDVLTRFATRAYRRPVDARTVERLITIAENTYTQPGKRFEDGIAQAIVPVLASPRFLFREEEAEPGGSRKFPLLDEFTLASRLSCFLWSTMPDEELFGLAQRGELRRNLDAQVKRMLADKRSAALVQNFVGQWLQTRDVEGIDINARVVLARDAGEERDFRRRRERIQFLNAIPEEQQTPEQKAELEAFRAQFRNRQGRFGRRQLVELDRELRRAMRDETEMSFSRIVRENRSLLELIDADYTFLNERLAKHYALTNLDVTGPEMRLVNLPKGSPRGGVLTHGAVLVVTSNPTRTSPVKRGLFILDNILGLPTPPPPPDIPNLEDSEKPQDGREPTLREVLAIHREKPLCASCHNRMDPLGLALENFNALGMWRDTERKQPIDAAGKLVTGETFSGIREVKRVLATNHRQTFYRCVTEKLLTYALGRGIEYYDVETVDRIVERLETNSGRFSTLLTGIIESAPFQKRRQVSSATAAAAPSEHRAEAR